MTNQVATTGFRYGSHVSTAPYKSKSARRGRRRRGSGRGKKQKLSLDQENVPPRFNHRLTDQKSPSSGAVNKTDAAARAFSTGDGACKTPAEDKTQYVALDCEMVGVGPMGKLSVLARVSITDWDGKPLLDAFIRIHEKVTDYRTFVSGIRPEDVKGPNAMDFGECRKRVIEVLRNKIVVGHGLANDLKVLKVNHPEYLIRDTSTGYLPFLKYDHFSGQFRPQKLRLLSKIYLGRAIQEEGTSHDSCIDAQAALDLYKAVQEDWESSFSSPYVPYEHYGGAY